MQQRLAIVHTYLQVSHSLAVMGLLLAFVIHNPHVTEQVWAPLALLQCGKPSYVVQQQKAACASPSRFSNISPSR